MDKIKIKKNKNNTKELFSKKENNYKPINTQYNQNKNKNILMKMQKMKKMKKRLMN